ncbi:MAG: ATP-binding cassette domain-containing protein [Bacteroidales bacterium]|nr:ATP-binding cassette domain-containing protein [Bacteroidales bacterium]
MAAVIVNIINGSITIKKQPVLENITITIEEGDFWYFLGRTGSGKTSLLKALYGEIAITAEKAEVAGFNLLKLKQKQIPYLRRKMGMVFQDFQLLSDRSIYKNLEFVLQATGWNKKNQIEKRIIEVLEMVDMLSHIHKMPHQLSGGEQQKVCIARALLNMPTLLLFDEPTGNLDPISSEEVLKIIMNLKQLGKTIIMATHDVLMVEKFPASIAWFHDRSISVLKKSDLSSILNSYQ